MKAKANSSESVNEIMKRVSQGDILEHYFGITTLPTLINSPLRKDKHPSFSIYTPDRKQVKYIDFATGEHGDIYSLMQKYFNLSFAGVMRKIGRDEYFRNCKSNTNFTATPNMGKNFSVPSDTDIKVKIRDWKEYDIEYWQSYGISLQWLKYAEVYPISHKIVYKNGERYVFSAAKYAYCFVERKEGNLTLKVYQPFSKRYKWASKNDGSVVGLWTKIPQKGNRLVICSSLKDALCLWSNIGIPCVYVQSETTGLSDTALKVLKSRYKNIFICFDNDKPGLRDGEMLSAKTGFKNVVLPSFDGGKDISDAFKVFGKEAFIDIMKPLFTIKQKDNEKETGTLQHD